MKPDRRELDDELIHSSVVIVDTREGALRESGDIIIPQVWLRLLTVCSKSLGTAHKFLEKTMGHSQKQVKNRLLIFLKGLSLSFRKFTLSDQRN